ncbi:hypothetical protein ACS0TY_034173 [Phlomoides rotata]
MRSYAKEYITASLIREFLMIAVFCMLDPLLLYVLPETPITRIGIREPSRESKCFHYGHPSGFAPLYNMKKEIRIKV